MVVIITLPAVQAERDRGEPLQRTIGIHAQAGVAFPNEPVRQGQLQ